MQTFPKRATVMGLGRFGGGIGVTRFLASGGSKVLVTDIEAAEELGDSVAKIQDLIDSGLVELRLGGHDERDFVHTDLVVANAAVPRPWDNGYLLAAERAGVPVTTEIAMMIERLPAHTRERTVAITGSAGKSTTTTMVHHALRVLGEPSGLRAVLGGNIGISLLETAHRLDSQTFVVLELSSAQLYWMERVRKAAGRPQGFSPKVAVVTNISPNHIDWHGSFDHYRDAKRDLIRFQSPADTCVLGDSVWDWRGSTQASPVRIDPAAFPGHIKLPGDHNRLNAAAALAAVMAIMPGADPDAVRRAIAEFPGLAHRLQLVAQAPLRPGADPVMFYNDSKSTTPDSCLKAIEALEAMPGMRRGRIHLIAGGYDKGSDLTPVARLASDLGGLYAIGATGPRIVSIAGGASGRVSDCGTLEHAIHTALPHLQPGDCLLLSPACASWDQYVNFEARGDEFVALVNKAVQP